MLPLAFLSSVMMAPAAMPGWVGAGWPVQPGGLGGGGQPGGAGGADPDWAAVLGRLGLLAALAVVMGWLATRAFRAYQKSL